RLLTSFSRFQSQSALSEQRVRRYSAERVFETDLTKESGMSKMSWQRSTVAILLFTALTSCSMHTGAVPVPDFFQVTIVAKYGGIGGTGTCDPMAKCDPVNAEIGIRMTPSVLDGRDGESTPFSYDGPAGVSFQCAGPSGGGYCQVHYFSLRTF